MDCGDRPGPSMVASTPMTATTRADQAGEAIHGLAPRAGPGVRDRRAHRGPAAGQRRRRAPGRRGEQREGTRSDPARRWAARGSRSPRAGSETAPVRPLALGARAAVGINMSRQAGKTHDRSLAEPVDAATERLIAEGDAA